METKLFVGLGIITIISGILLIIQKQYFLGIPGSFVGIWLVIQNMKKIKANHNE